MFDTLLYIAQFIVGLTAIVKGADWLTDGAASIARHFGIPTIVVGLTIVAMGSSAPELVVSVVSAFKGNVDMALGNVVGSNIFNILAIMGITAIVKPVQVERSNIRNDVPFALLSSIVVAITAFDTFFTPGEGVTNSISRTDGLLMLCMFAIFMSYTLSMVNNPSLAPADEEEEGNGKKKWTSTPLGRIGGVVIGLGCLILGGNWFVDSASALASQMGISDSIIALTIVSAGTSAPELAASVMAARKGDTAMALGNVVGSVIFNVFFVLGLASSIHPLGIGGISGFDILTLLTASCMLWMFCRFGKTKLTLTRTEGCFMAIMAVAYYTYLVVNA